MRRALTLFAMAMLVWGCGEGYGLGTNDGGAGPDVATSDDGGNPGDDAAVLPDGSTGCTAGETQPCTCAGQPTGTQTCEAGGTWGACECPPPDCTPVGHDEDGDGVDDACDNCPTWPNPGQANADGDGIGDACEAPSDAGLLGEIVHFEPFVQPSAAGWQLDAGWTLGADVMDGNVSQYGSNATWQTQLTGTHAAEAVFTYAEPFSNGWAGVRWAIDGDAWWGCLLRRTGNPMGGMTTDLELWNYPGWGTGVNQHDAIQDVEPSDPGPDVRRTVRAIWDGGQIRCQLVNGSGDTAELVYTPQSGTSGTSGWAGFRVYEEHAIFRSFVAYQ